MSARRVGFGREEAPHGRAGRGRRRAARVEEIAAATAGNADEGDAGEARRVGLAARLALGAFVLVWLTFWSVGLSEAFGQFVRGVERGEIFTILFMGFWLFGAGLGWLFGAVLLIALLFGKATTGKLAEARRRMAERRKKRLASWDRRRD